MFLFETKNSSIGIVQAHSTTMIYEKSGIAQPTLNKDEIYRIKFFHLVLAWDVKTEEYIELQKQL